MIFWFFVAALIFVFAIMLWDISRDPDNAAGALVVLGFLGVALASFPVGAWIHHASDLSKITSQHHIIEVYQERIESLERRLSDADYPGKSLVSVDADTPWATMMNELSRAETELAKAKSERATAIRSVEARRYGPMSGVIWLVGDVPEGNDNG